VKLEDNDPGNMTNSVGYFRNGTPPHEDTTLALKVAMPPISVFGEEKNPRGIPKASFIVRVQGYGRILPFTHLIGRVISRNTSPGPMARWRGL